MEQKKLDRINELARKSRVEELTPEEKEEQQRLRQEYIEAYRKSLRASLENMVIVEKDGTQTPVRSKKQNPNKLS